MSTRVAAALQEAQQACAIENSGIDLIVVLSVTLLVTGPLRVTVACWGGACCVLLSTMLVVVSVFVVGADSQQHVSAEALALCVCTSGIAPSAGPCAPAEVCAVFSEL